MAFHAGIFEYLAQNNTLEKISYVSSVSGGSLFTGMLFCYNGMEWPDSNKYISTVLPEIKRTLTNNSLITQAFKNLSNPMNWKYLFDRAILISKSIESAWGIRCKLKNLPSIPIWTLNGTTGQNGRRFRIRGHVFGDYEIGYTDIPEWDLSLALAMSAAYPGGIGPVRFDTQKYRWRKKEHWDSNVDINNYTPKFRTIDLYDGGLYDNLGLEPLFDIGRQEIKKQEYALEKIIVSDASTPLKRGQLPSKLSPKRIVRWLDISIDQIRSLRVRCFINFLKSNPAAGQYLQLGANPLKSIQLHNNQESPAIKDFLSQRWLSCDDIYKASVYPNTLHKMSIDAFEKIRKHGYQTALWNDKLWGGYQFNN